MMDFIFHHILPAAALYIPRSWSYYMCGQMYVMDPVISLPTWYTCMVPKIFWGCGSSMDRVPDCSPAVLGYDPSQGQSRHSQLWRSSLGKRTRVPWTCNRCRSAVQTSAEEEEVLSRRHRDNCSESRRRHQVLFAEMVSANVRDCWRMYEEMMILMSMEGRSWQSPTLKQQLPRTETMGKPSTHK